jgi:hypothetical protein
MPLKGAEKMERRIKKLDPGNFSRLPEAERINILKFYRKEQQWENKASKSY